MTRPLRALAFMAGWYLLLFQAADVAWARLDHHPVPFWLSLARLALWVFWCGRDFPGHRWVGAEMPGPVRSTEVVPEVPTAPLVGWRAWRIGERIRWDGVSDPETYMVLAGITVPEVWPNDEPMHAVCVMAHGHAHHAPEPGCHCGIYAVADPTSARILSRIGRRQVYGPVLTWGRTQVHERGWRSAYARPLALVRPRILRPWRRRETGLLLGALGAEYAVPVLRLKEAKALAGRMAEEPR